MTGWCKISTSLSMISHGHISIQLKVKPDESNLRQVTYVCAQTLFGHQAMPGSEMRVVLGRGCPGW